MLTAEEQQELDRCRRFFRKAKADDRWVLQHLGAIARPHNLDTLLAELPAALVEPLRALARAYRPVRAIGYWCPSGFPPSSPRFRRPSDADFPDPRRLVCAGRYPADREAIAAYLRRGHKYAGWRGVSYCRFRCGIDDFEMGSRCLTDGAWVWPEGLPHYVEAHSVLLPEEFITQVAARDDPALSDGPLPSAESQGEPDFGEWIAWGRSAMAMGPKP